MTFRVKRGGAFVVVGSGAQPEPWIRPADWLALPVVAANEQKMVGLYAVEDHPYNVATLQISGACTINWGDGSASENFAAAAQAEHTYSYAALPAGTTTTKGYRQAIITVTMQAGQNLTSLNLGNKPAGAGSTNMSSGWLDIEGAGTLLAAIVVNATNAGTGARARLLERFVWRSTMNLTSLTNLFSGGTSIQEVSLNTAGILNMSSMFAACHMLTTVPLFDTSTVTNFASMFSICRSLKKVPLFNTAAGTNLSSMFSGCESLQEVPLLNLVASTDISSMFNGCRSLRRVPDFNTPAAVTTNSMFFNATSLEKAPTLNTQNVTNMASMFQNCAALKEVPAYNFVKVTTAASMFSGCSSLERVGAPINSVALTLTNSMFQNCGALEEGPMFNTALVTTFASMFDGCSVLKKVPLYVTTAGTTFTSMFQNCTALRNIPALDLAGATGAGTLNTIFNGICLGKCDVRNAKVSFSLVSSMLTAAELNRVYTNLASGVTAQTITVTGNIGNATDDPTIATAKGWTVTG